MSIKNEEKMVFAVSKVGDEPLLLLGIPASAWEYMKDGKRGRAALTKAAP